MNIFSKNNDKTLGVKHLAAYNPRIFLPRVPGLDHRNVAMPRADNKTPRESHKELVIVWVWQSCQIVWQHVITMRKRSDQTCEALRAEVSANCLATTKWP